MARRICKWVVTGFALLYLAALFVLASGLFGWFGEPDPLAGVFVVLLGQPWVGLIGAAPQSAWPWLAALSPLVNLLIIAAICRIAGRPGRRR